MFGKAEQHSLLDFSGRLPDAVTTNEHLEAMARVSDIEYGSTKVTEFTAHSKKVLAFPAIGRVFPLNGGRERFNDGPMRDTDVSVQFNQAVSNYNLIK